MLITTLADNGQTELRESSELILKEYTQDNENDIAEVIEYWEGDKLRHRSVVVNIKRHPSMEAAGGQLG